MLQSGTNLKHVPVMSWNLKDSISLAGFPFGFFCRRSEKKERVNKKPKKREKRKRTREDW